MVAPAAISEVELKTVFQSFDADNGGSISVSELGNAVAAMGMSMPKKQLESLVKEYDADNSGEIEFSEFQAIMEQAASAGKGGQFSELISRKNASGPPMLWSAKATGDKCTISPDGKIVSRDASCTTWGLQLLDQWCAVSSTAYDRASVLLEIGDIGANAYIGVVGRNYLGGDWDGSTVSLQKNRHACVVHAETGLVYLKESRVGDPVPLKLGMGLKKGMQLQIELAMRRQEIRMELLKPKRGGEPGEFEECGSVTVDGLPAEVAIAASLGPGAAHSITLIGSSTMKGMVEVKSTVSSSPIHRRRASKEIGEAAIAGMM